MFRLGSKKGRDRAGRGGDDRVSRGWIRGLDAFVEGKTFSSYFLFCSKVNLRACEDGK